MYRLRLEDIEPHAPTSEKPDREPDARDDAQHDKGLGKPKMLRRKAGDERPECASGAECGQNRTERRGGAATTRP